jgi:HEAT repeat protein
VLTDVTGSNFSQAAIESLKDLVQHNKPYVKASALVGLSALTRVVFRALLALTRRDIRVFESRAQAIAYLLSKRAEPLLPVGN